MIGLDRWSMWGRVGCRRRAVDTLVSFFALAVGLAGLGLGGGRAHYRSTDALAVVLAILATLPLAWRRAWPGSVLVVVGSAELANVLAGYRPGLAWTAVLFAVYSFAAERGERSEVWAILVWAGELGAMTALAPHANDPWYPGALFAASAFAWLRGDWSRSRRREEERARSERARVAVADERARIARELHDVVAHALGVIVMQAGGAGALAELDQDRARRVLSTIEHTGRQAFTEMRRLVGVLREDPGGETLVPPPSMSALPALVEEMNEAGLSVSLEVAGTPSQSGEGAQLSAYRIVQEALTNTLKHAGPTHAAVRVSWSARALQVEITDQGPVDKGERSSVVPVGTGGHGLVGMRERVALYDGEFEAAATSTGGFRVRARLPFGAAE